jgi:pimeloyl-ACP methyl ester carboxylesterase
VAVTSRGYELSSMPADGSFHVRNLAQDVVDWALALGETNAHLVGPDWGATIAYAATTLEPDSFHSQTAMAAPQPRRFGEVLMSDPAQPRRSAHILFFQQVGVAEAAIAANDFAYLEDLWRQWSPGWAIDGDALAALKEQFGQDGVPAATPTCYRQALETTSLIAQAGAALLSTPIRVPTLAVYGSHDGCTAADVFGRSMRTEDFPAGLSLQRADGSRHFLHQEQHEVVNQTLIGFLYLQH